MHYTEIDLGMMNMLYGHVGHKLLHIIRINRTVPLYNGVDQQGISMSNQAMNGAIETIQKNIMQ